jgi:hypothetical protein
MPGEFTALKRRVADYLRGLDAFKGANVLLAFPGSKREFPLKKPLAVIEVLAAEVAPAGLGGGLSSASVTLGASFYCPEPEACCAYYEALCDALFGLPELSVRKISRGRTAYDPDTAAYRAEAEAVLAAALALGAPGERLFTDFRLEGKEVAN